MFEKLKAKAAQPLTHGWLWKLSIADIIAVGIIYGGLWAYGAYLEKACDAKTEMDHNKFKNKED